MKQNIKVILALVCVLFFLAPSVQAGWFSKDKEPDDIDKGSAFLKQEMFTKAIRAFEKGINTDPTNKNIGEAHYQLAILYLHKDNLDKAIARFKSAIAIGRIDKKTVSEKLKFAGDIYLQKGLPTKAIRAYRTAMMFYENQVGVIARKCYDKALFYLSPKIMLSSVANQLFAFAIELDPDLEEQAKIEKIAYAKKMLALAKPLPRAKQKPFVKEAQKYLAQTEIDKVIPPPSWKSRPGFPKTFTGQGYDKKSAIVIATIGKDWWRNDKIIISGPEFAIGRYDMKKNKKLSWVNQSSQKGLDIHARSAQGVKFRVDIKCFK